MRLVRLSPGYYKPMFDRTIGTDVAVYYSIARQKPGKWTVTYCQHFQPDSELPTLAAAVDDARAQEMLRSEQRALKETLKGKR